MKKTTGILLALAITFTGACAAKELASKDEI